MRFGLKAQNIGIRDGSFCKEGVDAICKVRAFLLNVVVDFSFTDSIVSNALMRVSMNWSRSK